MSECLKLQKRIESVVTCSKCNKQIGFLAKKYYIYPAKGKGSLEITPEKLVCKNCIFLKEASEKTILQKSTELVLLIQNNKYEEALKVLENGFDRTSEADWYSKGNILGNLRRYEEAIQCYDEALFIDTHYTKAWYRKGRNLLALGRLEASACFENVLTLENEPEKMEWSKATAFCLLLCYLHLKKKLEDGGSTQNAMYELTINRLNYFKSVFKERFTLTIPLGNDDSLIKWYENNFYELLSKLEPPIVVEFRVVGKKH